MHRSHVRAPCSDASWLVSFPRGPHKAMSTYTLSPAHRTSLFPLSVCADILLHMYRCHGMDRRRAIRLPWLWPRCWRAAVLNTDRLMVSRACPHRLMDPGSAASGCGIRPSTAASRQSARDSTHRPEDCQHAQAPSPGASQPQRRVLLHEVSAVFAPGLRYDCESAAVGRDSRIGTESSGSAGPRFQHVRHSP